MKKLKRITALILSVLMLMSMSVAVNATSNPATPYTLYISNDVDGYVYTAYQVFTGTMGYAADKTTEILNVVLWNSDIEGTATETEIYEGLAKITLSDGSNPFTSNGNKLESAMEVAAILAQYTGTTDSEVAQLFADFIADYVVGTSSANAYSSGNTSSSGYYTITVPAGYYLIKNTTIPDDTEGTSGTRYILAMTSEKSSSNPTAYALEIKSNIPDVDKDISDLDVDIGDTVTYYLTASLPSDYALYDSYKLVFYDSLYKGLTFTDVVAVYVYNDSDFATNKANAQAHATSGTGVVEVASSGYTTSEPNANGDYNDFTVTLSDTKTLSDGSTTIATDENSLIQVVFEAELNSNAIIGGAGNDNYVYLEYSNDMYGTGTGTTVTDRVVTWTYEVDVTKVDADTKDAITTGAEFVLYRVKAGTTDTYEYVIVDSDNKVTGWTEDINESGTTLTSGSDGKFSVIGLDVGTYYLLETKAPKGYNKMSDPVSVEIKADYTKIDAGTWLSDDYVTLDTFTANGKEVTSATDGKVSVTVENNTGAKLPSTGGIGTTIFYIVGGVLVVGAIILLITKKRMGGDDK